VLRALPDEVPAQVRKADGVVRQLPVGVQPPAG
jgi:hypothetical protein